MTLVTCTRFLPAPPWGGATRPGSLRRGPRVVGQALKRNDDESDQAFRRARTPSIAHDMHNQLNTFIRE